MDTNELGTLLLAADGDPDRVREVVTVYILDTNVLRAFVDHAPATDELDHREIVMHLTGVLSAVHDVLDLDL